jgi:hypothetical protein
VRFIGPPLSKRALEKFAFSFSWGDFLTVHEAEKAYRALVEALFEFRRKHGPPSTRVKLSSAVLADFLPLFLSTQTSNSTQRALNGNSGESRELAITVKAPRSLD